MSDQNCDSFLTCEIFSGMSMWAFLIIIVSAIVFLVIVVLFVRMRRQDRQRQWSSVLFDNEKRQMFDSKEVVRPKEKLPLGTDNPGWEDYPDPSLKPAADGDLTDGEQHHEDPTALYALPIKKSDRQEDSVKDTPGNEPVDMEDVPREAAPGSDVLYAKSMKTSIKNSEKDGQGDGMPQTSGGFVKVGEIALPQPSGMHGDSAGSQYEEVDLSAVAMARMSTADDVELTEL